jgi:uncharacterized protein YeaO (DUF488 family)
MKIKTNKANQIHCKEESVKIIEDKLCASRDTMDQLKLDLWLYDVDEISGWSVHEPEKWDKFKNHYRDEFEDKLELMDEIMTRKKKRVKVTWISVFKRKINGNTKKS